MRKEEEENILDDIVTEERSRRNRKKRLLIAVGGIGLQVCYWVFYWQNPYGLFRGNHAIPYIDLVPLMISITVLVLYYPIRFQ